MGLTWLGIHPDEPHYYLITQTIKSLILLRNTITGTVYVVAVGVTRLSSVSPPPQRDFKVGDVILKEQRILRASISIRTRLTYASISIRTLITHAARHHRQEDEMKVHIH